MVLLVLVILGVSIFCFTQGYIFIGVVCLGGFSGTIGFITLTITSILLFVKGHWIVGLLPLLLIGWNILGITVFKPHPNKTISKSAILKMVR